MEYFIGIDVGTGSARAGVFDRKGKLLAHHTEAITMWKPQADFVEQSSDNIWDSISQCVRRVMSDSGVAASDVRGIGFDATCSLVLVDAQGQPVSVSPSGEDAQNVIVWMDHRALEETDYINGFAEDFSVFEYVGGKISPEMQAPKLLWLKKNLPESWKRAAHFFDLPDYLTYRATGELTRSLCSTTCKWTYLAHQAADGGKGWSPDFFRAIGLEDLIEGGYEKIGSDIRPMGEAIGSGLSATAAQELGLLEGTPVGVSIIDAHAGGIGMIGLAEGDEEVQLEKRLALIGGTSSCHMAVSKEKRPIPGVWGPYFSSMVPGLWLNEGGQSATGALVDHVIFNHGASEAAKKASAEAGISIYEYLNHRLSDLAGGTSVDLLTRSLHVCPYFHGNRSPRANPHLKGMVSGLRLSATIDDLALVYLATIQAIAYGTRHIIEEMNKAGYEIDRLICCGGGTKNPVFLQQHANATGCRLILPEEPEAVLLGSAMLGAVASGEFNTLQDAMRDMSRPKSVLEPEVDLGEYHENKYKVFHKLYADQISYDSLMES
ncbi:FGGY-family carbohydrate kinase [Pelagicoccus mobilis]|uniref:FGGY-family carbohydrate kinase n=1 Tax=Pelagicoccus mobilis TaxID=415221 RepID=A0A934RYM0_9BACT|nr:FGGY-family carbohydrate kinase [Pelagicoccus mobilis]MBK1877649.1 FGGY-family carbohydrate kinase [Pelagicoccus mobilis]